MKKLDKKQIPQVAILVILSCALFGYFAKTMIMPSPAAAKVAPAATKDTAANATHSSVPATSSTPAATATSAAGALNVDNPPIIPIGRDPFAENLGNNPAPAVAPMLPTRPAAPAPRTASMRTQPAPAVRVPFAPPLPYTVPSASAHALMLPPMPVAPPWTVTGVLLSGADRIVILRSGEARRIVKQGDYVDSRFRVASVTRDQVVLTSGKAVFTLPLGGAKIRTGSSAASIHSAASFAPTAPAPVSFPPMPAPHVSPSPVPLDVTRVLPAPHTVAPSPRYAMTVGPEIAFSQTASATQLLAAARTPLVLRIKPVVKAALVPHAWAPSFKGSLPRPVTRTAVQVRRPKATVASFVPHIDLLERGVLAPDFSLPTLNGPSVALSELRGRVVVLNFWASWVDGCPQELAQLRLLQKSLAAKGLTVLNVNSWDSQTEMAGALNRLASGTPHRLYDELYDPSVSNESVAVNLYHAPDVPALYVINRNGTVAASFVGSDPRTMNSLEETLKSLGVS